VTDVLNSIKTNRWKINSLPRIVREKRLAQIEKPKEKKIEEKRSVLKDQ